MANLKCRVAEEAVHIARARGGFAVIGNNRWTSIRDGVVYFGLHKSPLVEWNVAAGSLRLTTAGWPTATTRDALRDFLSLFSWSREVVSNAWDCGREVVFGDHTRRLTDRLADCEPIPLGPITLKPAARDLGHGRWWRIDEDGSAVYGVWTSRLVRVTLAGDVTVATDGWRPGMMAKHIRALLRHALGKPVAFDARTKTAVLPSGQIVQAVDRL